MRSSAAFVHALGLVVATQASNFSLQANKHCTERGGCECDCSWASPSTCGHDDGSCCHACCCGASPGPTPPPTPPPGPVKHCTARGGCDCDCAWANSSTCGTDDGSCCWGCCCDTSPTPPPTPKPPQPPTPPSPGLEDFCPDPSNDFQLEEEPGAVGTLTWSSSGWTIQGQRRVSSKASFNMAGGGYIEWDMELSGAHGNVNNNFYLTYPNHPNCGKACYCDSGGSAPGCAEMDLTENNGNCWQATTWHPDPSGADHNGEAQEGAITTNMHFKAQWDASGDALTVNVGGNTHSGNGLASLMKQFGGVVYSSQWQGWVPGGGRCGNGDLGSSVYTVKNLKVRGAVVQGPRPRLCNATFIVV